MAEIYGCDATIYFTPAEISVEQDDGRWLVCKSSGNAFGRVCLHKNGNWGLGDWFASKREAEVAAVLAGMKSPEVRELKEANETAQKRLAAKQAVVDQVCKERDGLRHEVEELKDARANSHNQIRRLSAEVAKLKGDLAQAELSRDKLRSELLSPCGESYIRDCIYDQATKGKDTCGGDYASLNAVRKLRADYEAAKAANESLAAECWDRAVSQGSLNAKIRAAAEALA